MGAKHAVFNFLSFPELRILWTGSVLIPISETEQHGTSFDRIPSMSVVNLVILWPLLFSGELTQMINWLSDLVLKSLQGRAEGKLGFLFPGKEKTRYQRCPLLCPVMV